MTQLINPMEKKMKKLSTLSLIFTAWVFSMSVHAGSGHSHDKDGGHSQHGHAHGPISATTAKAKATKTMQSLAKRGVIDKSWTTSTAHQAEKKKFAKAEEWVVSFKNNKVKEKSKQTLYIFYSLNGHYIAANYTGK